MRITSGLNRVYEVLHRTTSMVTLPKRLSRQKLRFMDWWKKMNSSQQLGSRVSNLLSPPGAPVPQSPLPTLFAISPHYHVLSMPTLELFDTVAVKTDRSLIGTVERTHTSAEGYESLDEYFILRHVPVAQPILTEFVTSGGVPPRGHVFVTSIDDERGCFLAHEDDLVLLCRSFDLGDTVKRDDGGTGTVVDAFDSYSIQPIWLADKTLTLASALPLDHLQDCDPENLHDCPHAILSGIPGPELLHKQSLFEDDLVCHKEWLGVVQEMDVDVIVQFEDDSMAVLDSPGDLYIPVPEPSVPLVSLPELDETDARRPDLPSAFQGHPWVIPTGYPRPGTFVVTSRNTLRAGRWIRRQILEYLPEWWCCHRRGASSICGSVALLQPLCSSQGPPSHTSGSRTEYVFKS